MLFIKHWFKNLFLPKTKRRENRGYLKIDHFNALLKAFSVYYVKSIKLSPQMETYRLYVHLYKNQKETYTPYQLHSIKNFDGSKEVHPNWPSVKAAVTSSFYPVFQKIMREGEEDLSKEINYFKLMELHHAMNQHLFEMGNALLYYIAWELKRISIKDNDILTYTGPSDLKYYSFGSNVNSATCIHAIQEMYPLLPTDNVGHFDRNISKLLSDYSISYDPKKIAILKNDQYEI